MKNLTNFITALRHLTEHGPWRKRPQQLLYGAATAYLVLVALQLTNPLLPGTPLYVIFALVATLMVVLAGAAIRYDIDRERTRSNRLINLLKHASDRESQTHLPNRHALINHLNSINFGSTENQLLMYIEFIKPTTTHYSEFEQSINKIIKKLLTRNETLPALADFIARPEPHRIALTIKNKTYATTEHANLISIKIQSTQHQNNISIPFKIGIAQSPQNGQREQLIQSAEIALEKAKSFDLPFSLYSPSFDATQRRAKTIIESISPAIEADQLHLHYQAQVCLKSGEVTGAEALLRWQHPNLGNIPPDELIPLAKASGKLDALEQWVINRTCRQIQLWENTPLRHIRIAINLSPHQFKDAQIIKIIEDATQQAGISHKNIGIEIIESEPLRHTAEAAVIIEYLKTTGIEISLDDFGTGYSTFSLIHSLPLSSIKIDKSTIKIIDTSSKHRNLVMSLTNMAHAMRLKVVAEGVETIAQMSTLQLLGADTGQGYLWNKPCSPEQFEAWFKRYIPVPHSPSPNPSTGLVSREELDALNQAINKLSD